jgi:uncharacterized phiE125 gp8 family phage protein
MLRIVDKASADPISLAEAKAQLRVTDTSNDVLIKALIPAATNFVQSLVQRVFVSQTLEWVLPCWRDELCIPVAPVTKDGIASIKYVDWVTQSQHTLDPSLYVVQTRGDSVAVFPKFGAIWPPVFSFSPEPIVIQFDAGYDDPSDLPGNVKAAILLQLRHLYSMGEVNLTLRKDTVFGLGKKQFQLTPEITTLIPDVVKNLVLDQVW